MLLQELCATQQDGLPSIRVLGIPVAAVERSQALDIVNGLATTGGGSTLMFVNAHSLNVSSRDKAYRAVLQSADLVLNDGAGLALAARFQRRRFPDNLNGTDLIPQILERAAQGGQTVFFYGARPGVPEEAARRLTRSIPGLIVAGTADGFTLDEAEAIEKIRASGADLLLVAMGNPRQELWLDRNLESTGAKLGIAVGAFLDFAAGRVSRAPGWMRGLRLEWLYRLALEPKRLFRRYVVGNPEFVLRIMCDTVRSALIGTPAAPASQP